MFQIKRELNVSADEFFARIAESVAYDIYANTNKQVKVNQIKKGYSYTRKMSGKMGNKGEIKATITDFEAPSIYAIHFESKQGDNTLSYVINPIDDDNIEVIYTENYVAASKSKSWNAKIMQALYKRGNKKKVNRLITQIENYIISQRPLSEEN